MQIDTIEAAAVACANFTAEPKAFAQAAAFLAKRVIERRNTTPILSHIRIAADPAGAVTLTGTDLDQWASVTIAAQVETPGAVCVEAGPLSDALAKLVKGKAAYVSFTDDGQGKSALNFGRTRFNLRTLPVDDFPLAPTSEEERASPLSAFTMPAARLLADLAALAPCQSTEEARYYLNGVSLQVRNLAGRERLLMTATDGCNLAMASRELPGGAESLPDIIMQRKAVAMICHAAKLAGDAPAVDLEFDPTGASGGMIRAALGNVTIWSKAVDGTFPDMGRPFEEQLAPTHEAELPMFPELLPGTPLAPMAKIEKAAGQPVEWQDAAKGKLGIVPGDDGLLFACMNVTALHEPVKGYHYGYDHDRAVALRYLRGQAETRHGPIPFAWQSGGLQVIDGQAVGATFGDRTWTKGEYVERPNWETLVVEQVYIEPREVWADGSYSAVMPRESRRELQADVTLEIEGDGARYPIAQNSAGAIHLTADQVARMAGPADTRVIQVRTASGHTAHVYAAVWEAGALALEPCKANGAEIRKGFAVHSQITRGDIVWTSADGELHAAQVQPEAVAVEVVEIPAPVAAEREGWESNSHMADDVPDALSGPEIAPDEPVTEADELPAPEAVKESLTTGPDQMAELAARVAALEARLATLPAESTDTPSGEAARPRRTAAHERAVRRAWAERSARREAEADATEAQERVDRWKRKRAVSIISAMRLRRELDTMKLRAASAEIRMERESERAWDQWGKRKDNAERARRMVAAARHERDMARAGYRGELERANQLTADLATARMTPRYSDDAGREAIDLVSREASRAFHQRDRADALDRRLSEASAARDRLQEQVETLGDAMVAATARAIRAETALAAIEARANGWPPAVRNVQVHIAA